ncbi:MAG TPA: LysM peptidoglycan-binding domain-containing protein [Spongiibacteraceae bacterium]|jgi:nucleoid-associated protein YgaU|nr:LysM peptidoglycan-binding domain-containing protein [Spongiibacteraceae bacterium]HUH38401.1 LysM peptidoglycan-binding domain-containing protein [Spongiibacteraceae bacterium]
MNKKILAAVLAMTLAWAVHAGDVLSLKDGHPETYVVKKGDTLWAISSTFLQDPWLWPELWHINPQVDNPHLIYPGDILKLVWINGKPKLVVSRGGDVKLGPAVRISELDLAIPAIPLDVIDPFLSRSRVVAPGELEAAPYILAAKDRRIVAGAGDEVYARGEFEKDNQSFGIFRKGDAFIDPDTDELLGIEAYDIGTAKLREYADQVATLALNRTTEEVRRGDRLLAEEEGRINANFFPAAPDEDIQGYLLKVAGGVSQIGQYNVVSINKGQRDGLAPGHVLAIYRTGETVRDPITNDMIKVPDTRAGLMMVFRTFDKVSYGVVLKATRPLAVMDKVRNP